MKFKIEVCLLGLAIFSFVASMFFFGYQTGSNFSLWTSFPYRIYSLPIVGFGSALLITASISYSKRSKNIM